MRRNSIKAIVTACWVGTICAVGIASNWRSLSGWVALTGLAVLPPLVMIWRWKDPQASMSESIQKALRERL